MTKARKPIQVKSILKKRDAPIPITQFGKPVVARNDDDDDGLKSACVENNEYRRAQPSYDTYGLVEYEHRNVALY